MFMICSRTMVLDDMMLCCLSRTPKASDDENMIDFHPRETSPATGEDSLGAATVVWLEETAT